MLFGGGSFSSLRYNTTTNVNKPSFTVTPFDLSPYVTAGELASFDFNIPAEVQFVTAQVWGGGGASGSTFNGISGDGGGGGYVSGIIPVGDLGITQLSLKVGGGGGISSDTNIASRYYDRPSDEYGLLNVSDITYLSGNSNSNNPTVNPIDIIGSASVSSSLTVSTITNVGSVSNTNVTSLTLPAGLAQDDIVIVISSIQGNDVVDPPTGGYSQIQSSNTNARSYSISYKRMGITPDTTVSGLQNNIGQGGGNTRQVAHVALIFRGVTTENIPYIQSTTVAGTGNPNPPAITNDSVGCAVIPIAFSYPDGVTVNTPPTGYQFAADGNRTSGGQDGERITIMTAYDILLTSGSADPQSFGVNPNDQDSYTALTISLRPQKTITPPGDLNVPATTGIGDFILVASVSDGSNGVNLPFPSGYTQITSSNTGGPSYTLSYKYATVAGAELISGLASSGFIDDGAGNGEPAGIVHTVISFRNVVNAANRYILSTATGTGNPNPPSVTGFNIDGYRSVAFGFLDNVSRTPTAGTPNNYTSILNATVGTDPDGDNEASIMIASRSSLTAGTNEDPGSFTITGTNQPWVAVTLALRPTVQPATPLTTLAFPAGYAAGDLVFCSSVSDGAPVSPGGGLNIPLGFTPIRTNNTPGEPAYQLSYRVLDGTETTGTVPGIQGLSGNGIEDGGDNAGDTAGIAHACLGFRLLNPAASLIPVGITTCPLETGTGEPNPPPIGDVAEGTSLAFADAVIVFGFVDNVSTTPINPPANYSTAINARVGTNPNAGNQASFMSAYRILPTSFVAGTIEDPGVFNLPAGNPSNQNYHAITIGLRAVKTNKFTTATGGCGGSGGGFSGVFYEPTPGNVTPLLMAGGGGGGGGGTTSATVPIAGAGGPGGGVSGGNGTSSIGGGGGTLVSGGLGGSISPTINSGEAGVFWNTAASGGFLTGGRGANSPTTDITSVPLYGANATGGWMRGAGGGSSRNQSLLTNVIAPTGCGGGGGAGYYGGGGGSASGAGGAGGGGGGGSNYIDPQVILVANNSGIGTVPGLDFDGVVGYGGTSVSGGLGISLRGYGGGNGLIILSYISPPI